LLLEEQRTNLVTDSSLTTIGFTAGVSISSTTETNPEGIDFCRRLLSDAGTNTNGHRILVTASSVNNITVSAFVKKDTHRYVYIGFGGTGNSFTALFDIDPTVTGDRLLGQGGLGTHTNINAGYQNFPNGWVRIWAVGTTSGTDGTTIGLSPNDSTYNITNWNAAGTEAIFIHGVQYEDNVTFPSSYIPTFGSAATRAADVSSSISGTSFSSWYRQDEGTVFVNQTSLSTVPQDFATVCQFNDTTLTNVLWLRKRSGFSQWTVGGESGLFMNRTINQPSVLSVAYKTDDAAFAAEGTLTGDNSCTIDPNKVEVLIGGGTSSTTYINGTIRRLVYWGQRLPDSTLSTITQ